MNTSNKVQLCLVTLIFLLINCNQAYSQAPPGYYSTVDESSPAALKASLHNIIKDHTKIPYTSSSTDTWDVLELAGEDVDNTNNVIALYKNTTYAKVSGGNNDYNREHSWPKSYGFPNDGSTNYPYTDMHHLFIANSSYNSSRSNKPFDICVSGCTEKPTDVNNGRGGAGQSNFTKTGIWDVWESRQGDVARALFYMAVRYEGGNHGITGAAEPNLELTDDLGLINASSTGSNESVAFMGLLSVLITWNNSDPVDIYEHMHNEAVYNAQGNRNPFIDNPTWASCVFELLCNGSTPDTTAPNAPMTLTGNAVVVGQISLDWFNNTEADLGGYSVYRSNSSGGTFNKLNTALIGPSAYTDTNIIAGSTYYYKVTATDNSGNESVFSTEISVTAAVSTSVLQNGVTVTGLSGATSSEQNWTMSVPSGATSLSFNMSGGTGDADLYVRFGAAPTTTTYDCRPYATGNNESCPIATAQAGTYYVMIHAYAAYSGVSLIGSYSTSASNAAPNASFTSSCTDLTCSFNGSGSSDSDGSIASYSWSFGGTGSTVSNTFSGAGTYAVTLTVTDNGGLTDSVTNNVTVTAPPTGGNVLTNGVAVTGLSAGTGADIVYTMAVPAGATDISFSSSGGTGDADMYVRFGATPTDTTYDCRPYVGGNSETCTGTSTGGTYYVRVKAYSAFTGVSLVASYTAVGGSGSTAIDTTTSNISVAKDAWKRYTLNLAAGYSTLTFTMSGGTGDADLYIRQGAQSTTSSYDCRPYKTGNNEVCTFNAPSSGTWYMDIRGYSAASGVSLRTQAN